MSGSLGDMGNLLKQAQKMQRELDHAREEIKHARVEGSAGDGAVRIEASGEGEVLRVHVRPDLVRAGSVERVEELMLAALREAHVNAERFRQERLSRVTGGLNLPGIF